MSQKTDAELLTQAGIIKNETTDGANTATRIGAMYDNIIDSKLNNEDAALEYLAIDGANASSNVDLGAYSLNAKSLHIKGTGGNGHLGLKHQSANITANGSESSIGANSAGNPVWKNDGATLETIMTNGQAGPIVAAMTAKATPVDADMVLLADSAASNASKKLTWANLKNTIIAIANAYADSLVVGLWDDRGNFDASGGNYPSSGGSGTAGAILKGDIWSISVAGALPTGQVVEVGDTVRALVDTPGNTQSNWAIAQNNIGYIAENQANKTNTIAGNESSVSLYSTIKGIVDWVKDGLTGVLPGKGSLGALDSFIISDQADGNKTKTATTADLIGALNGNVLTKISTDANNSIIAGTDGAPYLQEYVSYKAETAGYNCTPGDPIVIGAFNANPLPVGVLPNSIIIVVDRNVQMVSLGDYSSTGPGLQWDTTYTGVNVAVYWHEKL